MRRRRHAATLHAIDGAFAQHGWRVVMLIRLPYIPFVYVNYLLSATSVATWPYVSATALGSLPGAAFYTYLGSGIGNIQKFVESNGHATSSTTLALTIVGWVIAIVAFCALGVYAKRWLSRHNATATGVENHAEILHSGTDSSTPMCAPESEIREYTNIGH